MTTLKQKIEAETGGIIPLPKDVENWNAKSIALESVTDLRAVTAPFDNATFHVKHGAMDSVAGGGVFVWDKTGTRDDDGGITIKPTTVVGVPGILKRIVQPVFQLDWFDCPGDGSDVVAKINKAVLACVEYGRKSLFIHPGIHGVDRQVPIIIPGDFALQGVYGQSILKALGSTFAASPGFPFQGTGMLMSGDPISNRRYLTETGRVASGTGASFNLTVTNGAVTAASVVAGGTGYKIGDRITVPNSTRLTVTSVAAYKGAVTGVSVFAAGSGWGAPSNPVAQVSSQGQALWDRILDPATIGREVAVLDLVLDGDWGGDAAGTHGILSGRQYKGLDIRGHSRARVERCIFRNFPNDGYTLFDVTTGIVKNNRTFNCGWTGEATTSRNGGSHAGIYVTTNGATLNSHSWEITRNQYCCTGDVPLEFHWISGAIEDNWILDYGTLGIEGQASAFDTTGETRANNGGVKIPADLRVHRNVVDGERRWSAAWANVTAPNAGFSGTARADLPYAMDGIGLNAGNEGIVEVKHNKVRNTLRRALYATQNNNGRIVMNDNDLEFVARGGMGLTTLSSAPVCELGGKIVEFKRNRMLGYEQQYASASVDGGTMPMQGTSLVYVSGGVHQQVDVSDNTIDLAGFGSVLQLGTFGNFTMQFFRFSSNKISRMWGSRVIDWSQGNGNILTLNTCEIIDNQLNQIANNSGNGVFATEPHFRFITTGTGQFNIGVLRINGNSTIAVSATKLALGNPVFRFATAGTITEAEVRNNPHPNYTLIGFTNLPLTYRTDEITSYSSSATVASGMEIMADSSAASFTLTLPANPVKGDRIRFTDAAGTLSTKPVTIARNGKTIKGAATDFAWSTDYSSLVFTYTGATWIFS